ncbi:MAG: COG1470 family protein [Methylocystis sp.]|uniref:COG1470 family protein n=1 Tax=Methylocystis sp. TaxID=1911079 RepID=UPI003DA38B26
MFLRWQKIAFLSLGLAVTLFPLAAAAQTAVTAPTTSAVSARFSSLAAAPTEPPGHEKEIPIKRFPWLQPGPGGAMPGEWILQNRHGGHLGFQQKAGFPGVGASGYIPPDANIAVGKTTNGVGYVVQAVNARVAVYNKAGALVAGPVALNTFWSALGGACGLNNGGDPVVQYDAFADRWLISQIGSLSAPYSQCIAVSTTNDPTGAYQQWAYPFNNNLNDYPKFGVWPTATNSAYLASYNLFQNGSTFAGASLCAYDRAAMLAGSATPAQICVTTPEPSFLPADVDGLTPPADGAPPRFLDVVNSSTLRLYQMNGLNFANPAGASIAATDIPVASFKYSCNGTGGTCVPQPGTTRQLDTLGDRLMYRLSYRVFADHESMVVNHAVTAGTSVGIRWYELRKSAASSSQCDGTAFSATTFYRCQQGTFAPDAAYRWMGSAAMDGTGKIALGYSKSSGSIYPAIAFTGRTPDMPVNTMGTETIIQAGNGSQTGYTRWGDYTSMRVDPDDDATFWYTNEYYTATSSGAWSTAIASFKVVASATPDFTLSVAASASVTRGGSVRVTIGVTAVNGASSVSLSASGVPARTTASFSPSSGTASYSSTLTISPRLNATRGTYSLTITGQNGSFTRSAPLSLTIN